MESGNQYFEQQTQKFIQSVKDEELIKRSKECQLILDKITKDEVWLAIIKDCKKWVREIDSKWQDCNEQQLADMKVLKFAYNHIFSLPAKYKDEYKYIIEELQRRDNKEVIEKDYDLETNME